MKNKAIKMLDAIIDDADYTDQIAVYDNYFASLIRPKKFTGRDSVELRYDKDFEKNCIILSKYTNNDMKNVSVREYFSLLQHYNKEIQRSGRK